jgi:peroxiredoxin
MYGRTYMGNERTTFVIDADGKISHMPRLAASRELARWSSVASAVLA